MKISVIGVFALECGDVSVRVKTESEGKSEKNSFIITPAEWKRFGVSAGDELTTDQYEALEAATHYRRALNKGMELLSYGANSGASLRRKLTQRGYSREIAERVEQQLIEQGYIDEVSDADRVVKVCLAKGYGRRRIIMKLRERGYGEDVVDEVSYTLDDCDFTERCADFILKKYRTLPSERRDMEKLIAAMSRYGYSLGEIRDALKMLKNGA